jgi:hypothetical protein
VPLFSPWRFPYPGHGLVHIAHRVPHRNWGYAFAVRVTMTVLGAWNAVSITFVHDFYSYQKPSRF